MRRTGKTTRKADEAIQALFDPKNNGRIIIPDLHRRDFNPLFEGFTKDQVFIDEDATEINGAQGYLREIIIRRLRIEHRHLLVSEAGRGEICIINKTIGG